MSIVQTNYGTSEDPNRPTLEIDRSAFTGDPAAPWDIVESRFNSTMATATEMLELLVGEDGNSGYLGDLNALIEFAAPVISIIGDPIDTSITISDVKTPPTFDRNDLEDFSEFNKTDPELVLLPTIDISDLEKPVTPDDINPTITWNEIALNQDIYQELLKRIKDDLVYGATGLTTEVQEEIFNAGRDRQRRENDKAYQRVQNDIAGRGSSLPTGALLAAISEISAEILEQNSNLNRTLIVEQAELAQKNSQFIIDQASKLEQLLRTTRDNESNRSLDYEKAVASLVLQVYIEKVKLYVAIAEANKMYIEVQVANLEAIVSYNKGLIDQYAAFVNVYMSKNEAVAKNNASLTDVYRAEIAGYDSEVKAISTVDQVKLEKIKTDVAVADQNLRAAIANAQNQLGVYTTESNLKEKISNDMANIANQAMVGALSSVNANASLGYSGGESKSENWSHSDSLSESHSYAHDPES